ncbi:MAG: DUF2206 domain-containing protein [Nitrososphaerota archaeon]
MKINKIEILEVILISVGLSITFMMLAGLLVNELSFLFGIPDPLSLTSLFVVLNSFILVSAFLAYLKGESLKLWKIELPTSPLLILLFIGISFLSIVGAMWVNVFENNIILLFMIVIIALLSAFAFVSEKFTSQNLYSFAVAIIAFSLLFHSSLISNYLYTGDIHIEYFVFKTTQNNAYWSSNNPFFGDEVYGRMYSMLSVTILPTIYSTLLNMDSIWVFKILYPLIFCLVPLGLYNLWKKNLGMKGAFISTFLFMAYDVFYTEMLGVNRQIIAELFLVLLLLVILNKDMKKSSKMMCFVIFSFGLTVSHYGLSLIFLFFISVALIPLVIFKKLSENLTISMILTLFTIMFAWYIYISNSTVFESYINFGQHVYNQLWDFFNPTSRGELVLKGLGLQKPQTIWNSISWAFSYITEFLIVVGFIGLIAKRSKVYFERENFYFIFTAIVFLALLILVPGLANTLRMTRFYHILLFFIAPLSFIGAEVIINFLFKRRGELAASILLLVVLVPYFLFQTSFVYEFAKAPSWSVPLSKHRMDNAILMGKYAYVNSWTATSAQWVNRNIKLGSVSLYADYTSHALNSYGMIRTTQTELLSNTTRISKGDVVYFSYVNVVDGIIVTTRYKVNATELSFLPNMDPVYSNGNSYIYILPKS